MICLIFFFILLFSPDDVQSIISGKLALRYSGSQVQCNNAFLFCSMVCNKQGVFTVRRLVFLLRQRMNNSLSYAHVLLKTLNLGISCCCFAKGSHVCTKIHNTCTVPLWYRFAHSSLLFYDILCAVIILERF